MNSENVLKLSLLFSLSCSSLKVAVKTKGLGCLDGSAVECLPSAQDVIPESWDRVTLWAPHRESASPSAYVSASLFVSLMNK